MNQLRFKVGDRVVGRSNAMPISGKKGTIIVVDDNEFLNLGIEFDEVIIDGDIIIGHALNGRCEPGRGRWVDEEGVDLVVPPYFADARVGDSVYEIAYGEGNIVEVEIYFDKTNPIKVTFGNGLTVRFMLTGAYSETCLQTLFYSKPIFELPPPPKRKVKKVIEGWVNIYRARTSSIYLTKSRADEAAKLFGNRLGEAHFIRHEYEAEE